MGFKKLIDLDLLDRFLTGVKALIPSKTSDLTNDSGFITGMTILSYGSSTWNDFLTAYNANKIVYCRASSNSNPATGNQTRMAFMAYVNAATPTNVEFQYYRSVNSHSDTQQGDQVYVYKLDKTAGWTVTVRENYTKIAAGTGLSSSYSSGTLTLSNSQVVPTKTSDLTNDSGFITSYTETDPTVPAWAKASSKPTYTASEVGALPDSTVIPSKTSDLTNDSGFLTSYTETDPTVPSWAKQSSKPTYTASEVGALPDSTVIPSPATSNPQMDGTASVGSSAKYAKEDHRHPSDTTRVAKSGDTMSGTLTLAGNKYYDSNSVSALNLNNSDIIGLNGMYLADAAEDGREGINFPNGTDQWDSLYANNGKLYFSPKRPKGSAQGIAGRQEVYSIPAYGVGTTDISIRPMVDFARANRLAFLPANQIIIENTTDGGVTWNNANYSDDQKRYLFSTRSASIAIPLLNGERNTLCGVRITITGMRYDVPEGTSETNKYSYWNSEYVLSQERYCNIREFWFWISSASDSMRLEIHRATGANPNTWVTEFNTDFALKGWSGSDWVRCPAGATFGGGTNQTGHYWNWRLTFWSRMNDGATAFTGTTSQTISGINAYGDSVWGMPNSLMKNDHLYSWDANQNATFPANVTATKFIGSLQGNADTATNATKVNNHTVNSDVPANAGFLPSVSSSDNDKVLKVVNGVWAAATDSGGASVEIIRLI